MAAVTPRIDRKLLFCAACVGDATLPKLKGSGCASVVATLQPGARAVPEHPFPSSKESPSDAQIVSHKLMLRAGLVRQTAAGILRLAAARLPCAEEDRADRPRGTGPRLGAGPADAPTLQSAELWRTSGRYDAYGPEMLRIRYRHDREMLDGLTNEEIITALFRDEVNK